MSIYAEVNDNEPAFFSSSAGWTDCIGLSETLPVEQYPYFVQLCEYGASDDLEPLAKEIAALRKIPQVDPKVNATLGELAGLLVNETGTILVTGGMDREDKLSKMQESILNGWKDYP